MLYTGLYKAGGVINEVTGGINGLEQIDFNTEDSDKIICYVDGHHYSLIILINIVINIFSLILLL